MRWYRPCTNLDFRKLILTSLGVDGTITLELQGIIAWPVAKLLELSLGPHHGIIYRRAGKLLDQIVQVELLGIDCL